MHTSKHFGLLCAAIAFCAALGMGGCGRKDTAPPSEGDENSPAVPGVKPAEAPLDQQTEQMLDPLTADDVALYLKMMGAAAERVKNPNAVDKATLEAGKKVLAESSSGHTPTPDDARALERATQVALAMDQIIAEEKKIDGRTYRGIAEAVEAVVPNPALTKASGDGATPAPDNAQTPLEKRLNDINSKNEKFLAPYREEIQKLIVVVRNPANLPK